MTSQPVPPIELAGHGERWGPGVPVSGETIAALTAICPTITDHGPVAEASRDWWPLAMHWALQGQVARRAAAICRPRTTTEVSAVVAACDRAGAPVTASGGRSGVCGAAVPACGGIVLDTTLLTGIVGVDEASGLVSAGSGTFGPQLEHELRTLHHLTVGHVPQSFEISTVGGWVACRGAGQYSTRYGTISDLTAGLEVVLADGRIVRTGGFPAGAVGPDLTQVFVGSEGTLGVITEVTLRARPVPATERRSAYTFSSFHDGIEACRRIVRAGATPAVLRLYDAAESARAHGTDGETCVLLVLDEGDAGIIGATMDVVEQACLDLGARAADDALVEQWLRHRNDTSGLQALTRKGFVIDTMEIAAPWSRLGRLFELVRTALLAVPHARAATCHLSHSYVDGACLYFTFAATPPPDAVEHTYHAMWDAGQGAVLDNGGNLSHHHGIGINRSRFVAAALGDGLDVLNAIKRALDPHGILNPAKLGLDGPFAVPALG